jgi:hypothetical protein
MMQQAVRLIHARPRFALEADWQGTPLSTEPMRVQFPSSAPSFVVEHEWSSALPLKQVIAGSLPVRDANVHGVIGKMD